jgi:hypothetical protein
VENLINAGSAFTARTWIILAAVLIAMSIGMRGFSKTRTGCGRRVIRQR